ncbi:unnamed protein product [Pleuronectes platessa]|uniref:Uncharacterized protein n=1 Tax=Pleuronectes platessa TaxID=8262 RepID=A0A9N7UBI2_PLEPL|nr:unnamed protein product [Pleuronectes platessa]
MEQNNTMFSSPPCARQEFCHRRLCSHLRPIWKMSAVCVGGAGSVLSPQENSQFPAGVRTDAQTRGVGSHKVLSVEMT